MVGFSIGGDAKASKSATKSTTNLDSTKTLDLNQLIAAIGQITQATNNRESVKEQSSALGEESLLELQNLIGTLTGQAQSGDRFSGVRDKAIAALLESGMADVLGQGTKAGAYDSSVVGRAGERLTSRAVNEGVMAEVSAQDQLLSQIANLFNVEKGASIESGQELIGNSNSKQSSTNLQNTNTKSTERLRSTTKTNSTTRDRELNLSGSLGTQ